jgi:hypothetical protein
LITFTKARWWGGLSTQSIQHRTSCRIELHPGSILLQRILEQSLAATVVRSLKRGESASVLEEVM